MSIARLSSDKAQDNTSRNKLRRDLDQVSSGVKYKSFGGKREGMASMLDTGIVKHNLEMRKRNYGDGSVAFKMMRKNASGDYVEANDADTIINIGGRAFRPNSNGLYRILDTDKLDALEADRRQRRAYINKMTRYCVVSDEQCEDVLDIDVAVLGPNKSIAHFGNIMSAELDEYDATPSFLDALDPGSSFYAGGLAKLKKIVASQMPIVDNFTPDDVEKAGME